MLGRNRRNNNSHKAQKDPEGDTRDLYGVRSLIGGSGISLDGRSLQLPPDGVAADEESRVVGEDDASAPVGDACAIAAPPSVSYSYGYQSSIGMSLAGESLLLPHGVCDGDNNSNGDGNDDFRDEVSSINSSIYQGPIGMYGNLKIVGALPRPEDDDDNSPSKIDKGRLTPNTHPATPVSGDSFDKEEKEKDNNKQGLAGTEKSCLPLWLRRAPSWLKIFFVTTLVFIALAVSLVAVALVLVYSKQEPAQQQDPSSTTSLSQNYTAWKPPSPSFPLDDATANETQATTSPVESEGDGVEKKDPDADELDPENEADVGTEVDDGSSSTTTTEGTDDPLVTQFLLTGGRYPEELRGELPELLPRLPSAGVDFMMNLGDWNSPSQTNCELYAYEEVATNFSHSSVPVYFVVGDNELNDCDDEEGALDNWRQTLVGYETVHWGKPRWQIERQDYYPENIKFVDKGVLFLGLSLPSGYVRDERAWNSREEADLEWIEEAYYDYYKSDDVRVMVIFAHASPEYTQNEGFFEPFLRKVEEEYYKMHFVFIHRNSPTETTDLTERYNGIENLDVMTIMGSVWPPQQAMIDLSNEDEIRVSVQEAQPI